MLRASNAVLLAVTLLACASKPPQEAPAPEPSGPAAHFVSATILANDCGIVGKTYAKRAADAMHKLVEGCRSVPGGSMRFAARLLPGGRIDILGAADAGPPQPEVVPICILKHELRHQVPLKEACTLEVRLQESTLVLPDAG